MMAIQRISIQEFIKLGEQFPILDVRSPGEFLHAHIPGAHSLPLFTDEERKDFIHNIKEASDSTYKLLQNLLEWSRAQTGSRKNWIKIFWRKNG